MTCSAVPAQRIPASTYAAMPHKAPSFSCVGQLPLGSSLICGGHLAVVSVCPYTLEHSTSGPLVSSTAPGPPSEQYTVAQVER